MKTIKYIGFNEMLLIPAKGRFEEDYPFSHYLGQIHGENSENSTTVHVMIFNCCESEEISSLIDCEINTLKDCSELTEMQSQIDFFTNLKKEITDKSLLHDPPDELINYLKDTKIRELDKKNVIFLSGVSSLIED